MKNIIWNKPDGSKSVTHLLEDSEESSADQAQAMLDNELVPNDWVVHALDSENIDVFPAQHKTQFTSLEFLDRFTPQEQLDVVTATMTVPQVKLWYDRLLAASFIDLGDPRTEEGIDALIAGGLINADRKDALMLPEEID